MRCLAIVAMLCAGSFVQTQVAKVPTIDDVKKLQGQYQAERSALRSAVLVQREMQKRRSPLVSTPPLRAGIFQAENLRSDEVEAARGTRSLNCRSFSRRAYEGYTSE